MLKTISVVHLHCTTHIGQYFLRTGTGLDDIAPIGLSALFSMASEILGQKDTDPIGLSGIYGFSPSDDFGVLSCRDENVRFFLLFEGAGTDQAPTFRDHFLRGACLALFKAFQQKVPLDCGGIHHSEDETLSEVVAHAIPTHDLLGFTHLVPTHVLKFAIKEETAFSHEIHEYNYLGSGFRFSDVGQSISRSMDSLIDRSYDICAYHQGLRDQLAEFMSLAPYSIALIFGPPTLTTSDPKAYPRYFCFLGAQPLSLRFTFGIPVDASAIEAIEGVTSLMGFRRGF